MKIFSNSDSQKPSHHAVIVVAVILLIVAFLLAIFGVELEADRNRELLRAGVNIAQDQMTLLQTESVVVFVFKGLMGNIHSLGGTLQSYAIALTYVFTPFVVVVMLASSALTAQRAKKVAYAA